MSPATRKKVIAVLLLLSVAVLLVSSYPSIKITNVNGVNQSEYNTIYYQVSPYTFGQMTVHISGEGILTLQYATATLDNYSLTVSLDYNLNDKCTPNCRSQEILFLAADLTVYFTGNVPMPAVAFPTFSLMPPCPPATCPQSQLRLTIGANLMMLNIIPLPVTCYLTSQTTVQWSPVN